MKRFACAAVAVLALFPLTRPAGACSLCGGLAARPTLRADIEQAKVVVYGAAVRSWLDKSPGGTEFQIARVIKSDPALGDGKTITLPGYIPILDPKDPPRFVVFFAVNDGKLTFTGGRSVRSDAVLKYLEGAAALAGKDRTTALRYFFDFVDHPDEGVSTDAFLEFARANDQEVGEVARHLPAERVRKLLQNPKTPSERLGLYAFLLGAAGGAQDADLLRDMIVRPTERTSMALDGLLSGYINLRPREGWDLAVSILGDGKKSFTQRFSVARALRFYHAWKPAETKTQVLRGLAAMIPDGEVADLAIDDLRQWKLWDLTPLVLAQYGKRSHDAPIVRRTILRYALTCPLPEAKRLVDDVRRRDPGLIRDLEESLEADRQGRSRTPGELPVRADAPQRAGGEPVAEAQGSGGGTEGGAMPRWVFLLGSGAALMAIAFVFIGFGRSGQRPVQL
jgi:hypothetical protein